MKALLPLITALLAASIAWAHGEVGIEDRSQVAEVESPRLPEFEDPRIERERWLENAKDGFGQPPIEVEWPHYEFDRSSPDYSPVLPDIEFDRGSPDFTPVLPDLEFDRGSPDYTPVLPHLEFDRGSPDFTPVLPDIEFDHHGGPRGRVPFPKIAD